MHLQQFPHVSVNPAVGSNQKINSKPRNYYRRKGRIRNLIQRFAFARFGLTSKMSVDPDEIGFALSIDVRKKRSNYELLDIKVDEIYSYKHSTDGFEPKVFTDEELQTLVIYDYDSIEFGYHGESGWTKQTYKFSSNKVTIKEFVDAIIAFEKLTRPMSGDRSHVFYEGIEPMGDNGPFIINWGS